MRILDTKLGQNQKYKDIAQDLEALMLEGKMLGAIEGAKRVEFICDQYKHLSPNTAYTWLNPNSIQNEIEDAQTHTEFMKFMHFIRNIFGLLPLIMTWSALFSAMNAYSQYIKDFPNDHQSSFLVLWLTGFHGITSFTFTLTAEWDVFFLSIYLISILLGLGLENRARTKALQYINKLQLGIDKLMKCIMDEGLTLISDQSDIDRAIDGVKSVVDRATDALTKIVDHTTQSMNKIITDNFAIFKQHIATTEDTVKLYIDAISTTQKTTLNNVESTIQNVEHSMKTFVDDAKISMQAYIDGATQGQKQTLGNIESSVSTLIQNTQNNIKQVTDTANSTVTDTNRRIETLFTQNIQPLMTGFHQDMQDLHTELANYQTRLDDLTDASQLIAGASQGLMTASKALVDNAETYVVVGQDIETQISSLNITQQEVLSEIQQVASGITSVASSLNLATTNMVSATDGIEKVATQIDTGMTTTIQTMTSNVDSATTILDSTVKRIDDSLKKTMQTMQDNTNITTTALTQVETYLGKTAEQLHKVTDELASAELPWFLRRKRSTVRNKTHQMGA